MSRIIFLALLACSIMSAGVRADTYWFDGFESGKLDNWWTSHNANWQAVSASSAYVHSGSYRAQVFGANEPGGDILLLVQSTVGWKDIALDYWYKTTSDALEASDHIYVEWSPDNGANWKVLADYTNTSTGSWQEANFPLPVTANDNSLCHFRFRAVLSSSTDAMWFDDFALLGTPIPEPATIVLLITGLIVGGFLLRRKS